MATIDLVGDVTTTTALALASSWQRDDVVLVEADPTGGSIAAWLDIAPTPSLSSIVAALHRTDAAGHGASSDQVAPDTTAPIAPPRRTVVDAMVRRTPGGLRVIPCPF